MRKKLVRPHLLSCSIKGFFLKDLEGILTATEDYNNNTSVNSKNTSMNLLSHVCSRTLAGSLWSGDKSKGTTQNQIHVEGRITCGRQGLPLGRCEKLSSQTGQNICACLVQQMPRLIGLGREYQRHKQGQARGRHHIRGLKKPWCKRRVGCRQTQIWPLT